MATPAPVRTLEDRTCSTPGSDERDDGLLTPSAPVDEEDPHMPVRALHLPAPRPTTARRR